MNSRLPSLLAATGVLLLCVPGATGKSGESLSPLLARTLPKFQFDAVPMTRAKPGLFVVSLTLDGKEKPRFIVDTAASHSVLHKPGTKAAAKGPTHRLKVGTLDFGKVNFISLDLSGINAGIAQLDEKPIDGILGIDQLRNLGAVLDLSAKVLYVRNRVPRGPDADIKQMAEGAGYRSVKMSRVARNGTMLAPASVGKTKLNLLLDVGAAQTVFYPETAKSMGLRAESIPDGAIGAFGKAAASIAEVKDFQVGETRIKRTGVFVTKSKQPFGGERAEDGLLGNDFLEVGKAIIEVEADRMYMQPGTKENIAFDQSELKSTPKAVAPTLSEILRDLASDDLHKLAAAQKAYVQMEVTQSDVDEALKTLKLEPERDKRVRQTIQLLNRMRTRQPMKKKEFK